MHKSLCTFLSKQHELTKEEGSSMSHSLEGLGLVTSLMIKRPRSVIQQAHDQRSGLH